MTGQFGRRSLQAPSDLPDRYWQQRQAAEIERRRALIPDALRGSLLDPNGDRNLADDLAVDAREREQARRRYGPVAWLRDLLMLGAMAGLAGSAISYGGSVGYLPDWGLFVFPAEIAWLTGPAMNLATAWGFGLIAACALAAFVSGFARRMRHAGLGSRAPAITVWTAAACCALVALASAETGVALFASLLVACVVAGLTLKGRA